MRRALLTLGAGLLSLLAVGCACFRDDGPARAPLGKDAAGRTRGGCVFDWHQQRGGRLRISLRPDAPPYAEVWGSWALKTRLILPVGPAKRGARLGLRRGGIELAGWVAPADPVVVHARRVLHLGGPLWLRSGALRWQATAPGRLSLRAVLAPELRLAGGAVRLDQQVGCGQVSSRPEHYRTSDERQRLGLPAKLGRQQLVSGAFLAFSSRPGGPAEATIDFRNELRRSVEVLERQGAHARVLLTRKRYFLLGWVPASVITSRPPGLHWVRGRRRYRRGSFRSVRVDRYDPRERWRCPESLALQLRRDGRIETVGRTMAKHPIVVRTGRGLWRRVVPMVHWLRLVEGAELLVSRAALSGCERR